MDQLVQGFLIVWLVNQIADPISPDFQPLIFRLGDSSGFHFVTNLHTPLIELDSSSSAYILGRLEQLKSNEEGVSYKRRPVFGVFVRSCSTMEEAVCR
jgi:hypothetical protein